VGAELLHAEGQRGRETEREREREMTKLVVIFRNFPKAPKNVI